MAQHIYFVAAESSGDLLSAEVIDRIRRLNPDTVVSGIGGAEMKARGIVSPVDISPLGVLGLFEGVKAYRDVVRLADAAAADIAGKKPDTVVLVDSWGFMLRVAQRVRKLLPKTRLIKLIGPQVWATRAGRAGTLAKTVDELLCMYGMEKPFYESYGLPVKVIGNPAVSRVPKGDRAGWRMDQGFAVDDKVVVVLPGSRQSELQRVAPALIEASHKLKMQIPESKIVFAPAQSIEADFQEQFPHVAEWAVIEPRPEARFDAMAGADVAIACSGTVTTEIAMQGTPMVVAYKTGFITWALARGFLYKKMHISLINIVNDDQEIVPEFVQTKQNPDLIAAKVRDWLFDPAALQKQRDAQEKALLRLKEGHKDAAQLAAEAIIAS